MGYPKAIENMISKYMISPLINFLITLRILQNGDRLKDYGFTLFWSIIGMILPTWKVIISRDKILNIMNKTDFTIVVQNVWYLVISPLHFSLLVPAICIIGKYNPQLVNRDIRKLMPTRPILLIICIGCIWFQNLQYWVRKLPAIATICNETEPCANFVLAQLYRLQNGILQSLALALAGICSGQLVGTFQKVLNNTDLHNNALLFKETKTSLSLLLLVNLSFLIIDCIIKTYVFCYVRTNTEFGLRFVFAFSFVTYYCLALDDCFVALNEHISDLRFSFLYNFFLCINTQ